MAERHRNRHHYFELWEPHVGKTVAISLKMFLEEREIVPRKTSLYLIIKLKPLQSVHLGISKLVKGRTMGYGSLSRLETSSKRP